MTMRNTPPTLSVIIPVYNAAATLEKCLAPLCRMLERHEITEIIAVDDCSTDSSVEIARRHQSIQSLGRSARGGPGAARNSAAEVAVGTFLWFVDADVVVAEDAARVLTEVLVERTPAAVMGSYDDAPAALNFLSQYKNLVHHYYHHRGREEASTFWAGCGAVERQLFMELGGFDTQKYRYPSIEDIDLGYRIRSAGGTIILQRTLQGKHLKEWRLGNLLHTEIFRRAIPWSRLMLERQDAASDLNIGKAERMRALLAVGLPVSLLGSAVQLFGAWVPGLLVLATVIANAGFIRFFIAKRGVLFGARAFLFHQLYYLYSSASFALAIAQRWFAARRSDRAVRSAG